MGFDIHDAGLQSNSAKACAPSTRASPRLAVLRAKASLPSPTQPPSPVPSLPPKKRLIPSATLVSPLVAGKGTSNMSAQPIRRRSQRIAARGATSTSAPKKKVVIAISSDSEPEPDLEDTIHEVVEMDEDPEEEPQDA
ncbi:hypothetical protein PIB30_062333 [Stylosanthes scabra]|uniref:Uncharacterized protein n=1 Tax=Stylosanthes scabra TaxID=79078 RepID=A0ABU6UJW3_9FABA|nr:hypothetical protein [Stylosanthes scabra]